MLRINLRNSSLRDIQYKRDVLSLKNLFFTINNSDQIISLWILYDELYKKALISRANPDNNNNWFVRRLIVNQIMDLKKKISDQEQLISPFLDSLILISIDPKSIIFKQPKPYIPQLKATIFSNTKNEKVLVPTLTGGTSCFCDSVLVSMFLATDKYDSIIDLTIDAFSFFWEDESLQSEKKLIPWFNHINLPIESSDCFLELKDKKKTLEIINRLRNSLKDIATNMRKYTNLENYNKESEKLGNIIQFFRTDFSLNCKPETFPLQQDDPSEFIERILNIGGWLSIFFPMTRSIKKYIFKNDIFSDVKPRIKTTINNPSIIRLLISKEPITEQLQLQNLISDHFIEKTFTESHIPKNKEDMFYKYIIDQDPKLNRFWDHFNKNGFEMDSSEMTQLFRISDPFIFSVLRGLPSEIERIKKRVSIPKEEIINLPIMEYPEKKSKLHEIPYRLLAILCHIGGTVVGGHYVLYFRYANGDEWYYYDDQGPILENVDIHNKTGKHNKRIEKNSYLFLATRE